MGLCLRLLGVPEFEPDGAAFALAPKWRVQFAALFYPERVNDAARVSRVA